MSRSNRSELLALVGAGVIVLILLALSGLANLQAEKRFASERANQAASQERSAIEALLLDPHEQAMAIETRARRQAERENSDLDAQWATANWTLGQFIVGILGVIGLACTVYFTQQALHEAREGTRQARRAANLAQKQLSDARVATGIAQDTDEGASRAYVHAVGASYVPPATFRDTHPAKKTGHIEPAVENFGQTVATNVIVRYTLEIADVASYDWEEIEVAPWMRMSSIAPKQQPQAVTILHILPAFQSVFVTAIPDPIPPAAVLRGEVRYSDVFGKRYRSGFIFWTARGLLKWDKPDDFRAERVRMPAFQRVQPNPAWEEE